jgi:glutamyl-tRNA(Gln) amidotransferase subunit E
LGRLLRASKRVARGIGSIRQDVNISINNGNGIVEVKGVQRLDQLIKVIEHESIRQHGLMLIAEKLKKVRKVDEPLTGDKILEISNILKDSESKTIKKLLRNKNNSINAIRVKSFKGFFGFEPYPGVRIGKELGELVRFYGFGGIFHSDELPNYGITEQEVKKIKEKLEIIDEKDGFIMVGGPKEKMSIAIDAICKRLDIVKFGVPSETRSASIDGKTIYSRPKPGSARMYPETDIPVYTITNDLLGSLIEKVPKSWNEIIKQLSKKYQMNEILSEKIFDSNYFEVFEEISSSTQIPPSFIASKLTEDVINLERQGFDSSVLTKDIITNIFKKLDSNKIAKESVFLIFEKLMKKETSTVESTIDLLGIKSISDEELDKILDKIIEKNHYIIQEKGMDSINTLMGKSMTILRGKVDGKKINEIIKYKIKKILTR